MGKGKQLTNSLTNLVAGIKTASLLTGGSTLSSYGTIGFANNYSLLTLNRIVLTYLYSGNGIFQTAIQLVVQDALSKGIEIETSELSAEDIEVLMDWLETPFNNDTDNSTPLDVILDCFSWRRLYGGAGIVVNDGEDPEKPFNINKLYQKNVELYDIDRWQMDYGAFLYRDEVVYQDWTDREFFYIHGVKFHKSRIIRTRGKKAPYYIRRQLKGWGMSEGERMIRDLNLYLKTQDVLYEIIDESKIDIYKIKNFAQKLLQRGGTEAIQNRVMLANQLKNYVNALVLDIEEEYEQKSMSYAGLAETMRENRIGIASALRYPMTKLFGLSASGFNTGESDLENYNAMVESDVRRPLRPIVRRMLEIGCSILFGFIPSFTFKFPSLRVLSAIDEEQIKTSQQNRALTLYDRGLIESEEVGGLGKKQGWLEIDTKMEQGQLEPFPLPPSEGQFITSPSLTGPGGKSDFEKKKEDVFE